MNFMGKVLFLQILILSQKNDFIQVVFAKSDLTAFILSIAPQLIESAGQIMLLFCRSHLSADRVCGSDTPQWSHWRLQDGVYYHGGEDRGRPQHLAHGQHYLAGPFRAYGHHR